MHFSTLLSSITLLAMAAAQEFQVPVPWQVSDVSIGNVRHGTGGFWSLNVLDAPTSGNQSINTTCSYYSGETYSFAIDGAPYNAPCDDPSVSFGLYPDGEFFVLNITHKYVDPSCPCGQCRDNGTFKFSYDDVRGQEEDVQNNFGQAGSFERDSVRMYPTRSIASTTCEFCIKKREAKIQVRKLRAANMKKMKRVKKVA